MCKRLLPGMIGMSDAENLCWRDCCPAYSPSRRVYTRAAVHANSCDCCPATVGNTGQQSNWDIDPDSGEQRVHNRSVQPDAIRAHVPWYAPAGLLDVLAPPLPHAACKNRWDIYDAAAAGDPAAQQAAVDLCRRCVHLDDCRAWRATLTEQARRAHGVLAGVLVGARPSAAVGRSTVQRPRRRPIRPAVDTSAQRATRAARRAAVARRAARRQAAVAS